MFRMSAFNETLRCSLALNPIIQKLNELSFYSFLFYVTEKNIAVNHVLLERDKLDEKFKA